jgi:lysozyme family protein
MSYQGFLRVQAVALLPENDGQEFHVTSGDSGGATREGITHEVFAAWRVAHGQPSPSVDEFKNANASELQDLRHAWYWLPVCGDELPTGVDLIAFEIAFGSGPGWAARLMKRVLALPEDFRMSPDVVARAQATDAAFLVKELSAAHKAYVNSLSSARLFEKGWDRRIDTDEATALSWIAEEAANG